jgi:hypothetical protein
MACVVDKLLLNIQETKILNHSAAEIGENVETMQYDKFTKINK